MCALLLAKNKKALYDNQLLEKYTAGIVLKGCEVKAIREKKATFEGSYIQIMRGSPCVVNMYIGPYSKQGKNFNEQDARRTRFLLLNKVEIEDLRRQLQEKGRTAVPLALVLSSNNIKLEFAVVKGKKDYEKKITVKERQIERDLLAVTKEIRQKYSR